MRVCFVLLLPGSRLCKNLWSVFKSCMALRMICISSALQPRTVNTKQQNKHQIETDNTRAFTCTKFLSSHKPAHNRPHTRHTTLQPAIHMRARWCLHRNIFGKMKNDRKSSNENESEKREQGFRMLTYAALRGQCCGHITISQHPRKNTSEKTAKNSRTSRVLSKATTDTDVRTCYQRVASCDNDQQQPIARKHQLLNRGFSAKTLQIFTSKSSIVEVIVISAK